MAGVSTVTGIAANVSSSVLSGIWNKVVRVVKTIISVPQDVTEMAQEVGRLNNVIHGINEELAQEQRPPQKIVQDWLVNARDSIERSRSIRNHYEQQKNCLRFCPNCLCRYRISKRIRDWKLNVARLHSQKESDFPPRGEYGDPTPRPQVPIQNPESGSARRTAQTEIVEGWLTDEDSNVRRIGLLGMGGVGKTSLLDTINDSQKLMHSFELIIKVTVSKFHILDIQDCIASRLKLTPQFPHRSNFEERKDMLRRYLKNKKYVLLLDDMWGEDMWTSDELQELGVSLNDTGFKFVLTTRDKEVCTRMNVQATITVEPLVEEEGWKLFCSRAFQSRNGEVPHEIEEVARKVAKECKGLPLAIIVVAAAMTHHTGLDEWELALDQMRNVHETFYDLHPGVDKKLFQPLRWSYDVLPDYLKACFVYFAAYPEDRVIQCEELIDIWIAEGVVKGSRESYLPDIAHSFINFLRDRCLIEVVKNDVVGRIEFVKIHDVLRDLAIRIAQKEHGCIFKAGQGVSIFPIEEIDVNSCARLSLMCNHLNLLPTTVAFSSLSVLLLRENPNITEVPGSFLQELSSLMVLDLSHTGITSLPPSMGNLKHLASLQLESTDICELPESICDLNELQFLNLKHCQKLRCLPERISELKSLKALSIGEYSKLSHLPRGISEMVSLERLNMYGSNISLDFEEDANAERKYACFKDLQSLRRLRFLAVIMKSPIKEGVMANWWKLRDLWLRFDSDVNQNELPQDMQAMKDLERFWLIRCDVERLPSWLTQFRKLAYLGLHVCRQLKEVPAELPCLRELFIEDCHKLEELELGMGFPKLETLYLCSLDSLNSLECVGAAASGSGSGGLGEGASPLPMLEEVWVTGCKKLKRLRGGWDKLKCLERIISDDREWWDAIECDDPTIKTSLESKVKMMFGG